MDWQPIETAPKDGTSVLLWFTRAEPQIGRFRRGHGARTRRWWVGDFWIEPTHWMPLPPPPAALHDWRDPARPEARRDADGLLCADPDGDVS